MPAQPSRAIRLYGTDEPVAPPHILRAGPLSAELEAGNLRYIRFGGTEVMRAVSFIVRDRDWGTYNPAISDLLIEETGDRFAVSYTARTADAEQAFVYRARIEGHADGRLTFSGTGRAEGDFVTNRTGFVILHPVAGVAGHPVEMLHVDGRKVRGTFPDIIDPVQPMMDLRALTHWTRDGLAVTCLMEGDTFEMEDQRNWTDASYKTYVRPLALPWPYTLKAGEEIEQTITLTVEGRAPAARGDAVVSVRLGGTAGAVPQLGQGLDPDDAEAALGRAEALKALGLAHLVCHHDPRRGHGREALETQLAVARAIGAEPWLEAVIVSVDGFDAEVAALGRLVAELGSPFPTVLVSPAPDLKCTLPGSPWPPAPPAEALYEATRAAFPGKRIGGGMFSYFTELNRKRPPAGALDLVSFTTTATVHAGDDRSVMETIEALPSIVASAREIVAGTPYAVGPSAIGMRDNPYGAAPKDNPGNIRQAMSRNDPRQRGLLGAAWNLAYFSRFAYGGATAVALGAPVGALGAVAAPASFPQPWYEDNGGLYPVYHVLKGLAALAGRPLVALDISHGERVQGLAVDTGDGMELWLANLSGETVTVELAAVPDGQAVLDAAGFVEAARDPGHLDRWQAAASGPIVLDSYAVLRVRGKRTQ